MRNKSQAILMALALLMTVRCTPAAGTEGAPTLQAPTADPIHHGRAFAAPGRIEGATEVLRLGAGMDGLIEEVLVEEGQEVQVGATLMRFMCDEREARIAAAAAELEVARQDLARLLRGSRDEERRAAGTETEAARTAVQHAKQRLERLLRLKDEASIISEQETDDARAALDIARASLAGAREREQLVNAPALLEERKRAEARINLAFEHLQESRAAARRCRIVAPRAGTVLRVHRWPGEQVSVAVPETLVSLVDLSRTFVRAEIDERDVGRVRLGQSVTVRIDAYADRIYCGRVTFKEPLMGRKTVRTGDPAEKSDRDIQEVLVEMTDLAPELAIGLRVTARFVEDFEPGQCTPISDS